MNESAVRLVCFELCGEAFAFNMEHLIEIVQIRASEIDSCSTPVPFVRGTWMYRATPIYVIDFQDFFHLTEKDSPATELTPQEPAPQKKRNKSMLVVRIHETVLGICSDAVLQVVPLGVFYEYPDMISTLPRQYFAGIIRIRKTLALVLAIDKLVGEHDVELLARMKDTEHKA